MNENKKKSHHFQHATFDADIVNYIAYPWYYSFAAFAFLLFFPLLFKFFVTTPYGNSSTPGRKLNYHSICHAGEDELLGHRLND